MSFTEDEIQLAILRRKRDLLRRKSELLASSGLTFYKPHAKQDLFHRAGGKTFRYVRTGNRWGKSVCGAAEDVAFSIGQRSWYKEGDPARYAGIPKHPTKGLIITVDWDKATEIFTARDEFNLGKLWNYIPHELITSKSIKRNSMGHIATISLANGSSITLDTVKTFKNSGLSQESSSWDWVHVDEPCPREMFVANARGLVDRDGKSWITCTPLTEMWINDMFAPDGLEQPDASMEFCKDVDKFMVTGSITDNPHNTPSAIAKFTSLLTPDEQQCRLHGLPLGMAGIIYKEFKYNEHVLQELPVNWTAFNRPPFEACVRYSIDPHPKTPHAVVFAATMPTGHTIIYDELFDPAYQLIDDLAKQILVRTQGNYVHSGIIDPLSRTNNPVNGITMFDMLTSRGLVLDIAPKDLDSGIAAVKAELSRRDEFGIPYLLFSPKLVRMFYEFTHYLWDPNKANKPLDKDDHTMECLYRLCLNGFEYIDPREEVEMPRIADIQRNLSSRDFHPLTVSEDTDWDGPGEEYNVGDLPYSYY